MYPFFISFLARFKLIIRTSFSSISIRPLLNTLPYTLYNTIECRVEYLIKEARKLRLKKEEIIMINLNQAIMKGKKMGLINKEKKLRGVLNSVLKRTPHRPTSGIRLRQRTSPRFTQIWLTPNF
jgi:hypothetical protein